MTITITQKDVPSVVESVFSNGKIATISFIKKDGSERQMTCRRKVTKFLKGGKSNISHKKNLVSVYDLQSKGYRCINTDTVYKIKGCGEVWRVK